MRILFANIGWMSHYQGIKKNDHIKGGGSYSNEGKHEVFNFLPIDGICYGYVKTVKFSPVNLKRIDSKCQSDVLHHVLVVWVASHPNTKGSFIVGWYKNATIFRNYQDSNVTQRNKYHYLITAKAEDCTLLPVDQRIFEIPRANSQRKGLMGQSNVWYADAKEKITIQLRNNVIEYIGDYSNKKKASPKIHLKINVEAKQKVEKAAIAFVTKEYQQLGYKVISREKDNIGWDLDAERTNLKLKLEVKGLADSQVSVHITQNEYNMMMANKDSYRLCVVVNALVSPMMVVFVWDEVVNAWVSDKDESIVLKITPSYLAEVK